MTTPRIPLLFLAIASLLSLPAAEITWGPATNVSGASDVSATGRLLGHADKINFGTNH